MCITAANVAPDFSTISTSDGTQDHPENRLNLASLTPPALEMFILQDMLAGTAPAHDASATPHDRPDPRITPSDTDCLLG